MSALEPDTITERAALIAWHLAHGESMQTRDVAEMTGLTFSGAWRLMDRLSRTLPIYQTSDGLWQTCAMLELEYAGLKGT